MSDNLHQLSKEFDLIVIYLNHRYADPTVLVPDKYCRVMWPSDHERGVYKLPSLRHSADYRFCPWAALGDKVIFTRGSKEVITVDLSTIFEQTPAR